MRVREEADSLRRDVASQHALQQASQTELAREKQRRAEESELLAVQLAPAVVVHVVDDDLEAPSGIENVPPPSNRSTSEKEHSEMHSETCGGGGGSESTPATGWLCGGATAEAAAAAACGHSRGLGRGLGSIREVGFDSAPESSWTLARAKGTRAAPAGSGRPEAPVGPVGPVGPAEEEALAAAEQAAPSAES